MRARLVLRGLVAALAVLGVRCAARTACGYAYEDWLAADPQRPVLPAVKLRAMQHDLHDSSEAIMRNVRRNHLWSLANVTSAALVGLALMSLSAGRFPSLSGTTLLAGLSATCFAWATLARLEWLQGSYGGSTVFEIVDHRVFEGLYWLGTLLAAVSVAAAT
jgi:hypothetical protein